MHRTGARFSLSSGQLRRRDLRRSGSHSAPRPPVGACQCATSAQYHQDRGSFSLVAHFEPGHELMPLHGTSRRRSSLQARGDRPNPRGMPVRPGRRHRDRPVGRGWGAGPAPARGPHWQRGQALDSEAPETSPAHTCKPPKKAIDVDTGHRHVEKNDRRATLRNEVPFNGTTSGSEHGRRGHRTSWARSGGDRRRGVCGRRPPGCP